MSISRKRRWVCVVAALALAAGAVGVISLGEATSVKAVVPVYNDPSVQPPNPSWVNSDGTVNESQMPATAPMVNNSGFAMTAGDGGPVMVPTDNTNSLPAPTGTVPPDPSGSVVTEDPGGDGEVVTTPSP